jgi:hypothetical protein
MEKSKAIGQMEEEGIFPQIRTLNLLTVSPWVRWRVKRFGWRRKEY